MSSRTAPPRRPRQRREPPGAAGASIDPRIRARRAEVLRAQARRRFRFALVIVALVLLAVAAWLLLHSKVFSARVVTVVGSAHTPSAVVVAAAGLAGGPPLLDVSPANAAAAVERLPWVATATVSLEWPDGVRIAVTERRPVAAVSVTPQAGASPSATTPPATTQPSKATTTTQPSKATTTTQPTKATTTTQPTKATTTRPPPAPGGWALVDRTGRVLADTSTVPPGLLRVVLASAPGIPGSTLRGAGPALVVASSLPAAFRAQVAEATESATGYLTLQLTSPITVDLGSSLDLHKKFEDVAAALAGAPLQAGDVIDVAAPDAPVISG